MTKEIEIAREVVLEVFREAVSLGLDISAEEMEVSLSEDLYHAATPACKPALAITKVKAELFLEQPQSFCTKCFHSLKICNMRVGSWTQKLQPTNIAVRFGRKEKISLSELEEMIKIQTQPGQFVAFPPLAAYAGPPQERFAELLTSFTFTEEEREEYHTSLVLLSIRPHHIDYAFSDSVQESVDQTFAEATQSLRAKLGGKWVLSRLQRGYNMRNWGSSSEASGAGFLNKLFELLYGVGNNAVCYPSDLLPWTTMQGLKDYEVLPEKPSESVLEAFAVLYNPSETKGAYAQIKAALEAAECL